MSRRLIRFKKGVPPYNAGEVAGFDPDEAERYVSQDWAEDVVDHDDPPPLAVVEDEGSDEDAPGTGTVEQLRAELEERKVDFDLIPGTGANGNVVKADLVRALESLDAADAADEEDGDEDAGGDEADEEGEDDPDDESED